MHVFIWKATNKNGVVQKGDLIAGNRAFVLAKLRKLGFQEIVIRQKTRQGSWWKANRISDLDRVVFVRQLSAMVNAGLPLTTCFGLVGKSSEKIPIHMASIRIRESIELGESLSKAMAKESRLFDTLTINLIRVAEQSGILPMVLNRLAHDKEKAMKLKGKILSAMTYPLVVIGISVLIFVLLMVKVVPVFVELYQSFNVELPALTQALVTASHFTQTKWWVVLVVGVVIWQTISVIYRKNEKARYIMDSMLLALPVFGVILQKAAIARFARTFSTMLSAGTPIMECLDTVAKVAGNKVLETVLLQAKESVMAGRPLSEPLEECELIPSMATQMIHTGESTGNLDIMLNKVAEFYEEELDRTVDNLKALIEPLVMVFLGLMIGSIVLSMYLPLLKIGGFAN